MIFVDEVVAMEHVHAFPRCISCHNSDYFAWSDPNDVLHTCCFIWQHHIPAALARQDLEIDKVNMDRMRCVAPSMSQLPDFILT